MTSAKAAERQLTTSEEKNTSTASASVIPERRYQGVSVIHGFAPRVGGYREDDDIVNDKVSNRAN
jgi:hypothetical protein